MRRIAVILVPVVCLVAAAASADPPGVHTDREGARLLPLPRSDDAFHFVIFGDRTGGPAAGIRVLEQAVRDTNLLDPDLVMTVGDLVQGYNETPLWMEQMKEFRGVMEGLSMPWYPVPGNHDIYWAGKGRPPAGHHERDYEQHFGPLWYWFAHKNAAFIVLYSDEGDPRTNRKGWNQPALTRFSEKQLAWLRGVLEAARDRDHVFLFMHHPRWLAGSYPGNNWSEVHETLREAGNVRAVFGGHIHRQRYDGARDGIEYFTLSTTGGAIPADVPGTGYLHHFNVVTVRKSGIQVATVPVGAVLDPRTMTPQHLQEVDRLRALVPLHDESMLAFSPAGAGHGTYRVRLKNPTTRPIQVHVEPRARLRGLWFAPDHEHASVAPGTEREFVFRYGRLAQEDLRGLAGVRLSVQIDYLAESARVALPAKEVPMASGLVDVPPETFAATADGALQVRGDRGCLELASNRLPLPDGPFTVEAWVKPRALDGQRGVVAKTEQSEYGLFLMHGRPSFLVFLGEAYAGAEPRGVTLEAGRWVHLAGVYDGAEVRLYVDGRRVARAPAEGKRRRNGLPLLVGAEPDRAGRPTRFFDGWIDEVRLSRGARYEAAAFEPEPRHAPDPDALLLLHLDRALPPFALDHAQGRRHPLARRGLTIVPRDGAE